MASPDAPIPVIQVTEEPVVEKVPEKNSADAESDPVLQMIIAQQKSKRKKFIFKDKQERDVSGPIIKRFRKILEKKDSFKASTVGITKNLSLGLEWIFVESFEKFICR